MPISSTQIAVTSAPAAVISSATTWANVKGASLYQPLQLQISNHSTASNVYLTNNSTAAAGFGIPPLQIVSLSIAGGTDSLFALTSAGATATIGVLANPA